MSEQTLQQDTLKAAIANSLVGMAMTAFEDQLIIVHMYESTEDIPGETIFDGTIWSFPFSMESGIVIDPPNAQNGTPYADESALLADLGDRKISFEKGWISIQNSAL